MKFRKDINGLRAFAVIAVVLFHFNAAWMPGGFAGVDVFFVISGFLMTGIIFRGIEQENFSILNFYVARANRIIPALALLCLALLVFGWFYLTPLEYRLLGKHAASSVGFLSNFAYWKESGYFDAVSKGKWLLHTWSLSVEWQFYIIYPLILVAMRKFLSIKTMKLTILIATVLAFIFCVYSTYKWPNASYFLLSARAWEMLIGGVAYLYPFKLKENRKKLIEWTGLILIIGSYLLISAENLWPGYLALFPVLGSFLIIQAQRNDSLITGNIVFQKLGAWSYSIYLWHWPFVVAIYTFSMPSYYIYIGMVLSVLLGFLSYKYIEKINFQRSFPTLLSYLKCKPIYIVGVIGIMGSFIFIFQNKISTYRFTGSEFLIAEQEAINNSTCDNSEGCTYGKGPVKAIVVGDSHSASQFVSIANRAEQHNGSVLGLGLNGCPTIKDSYGITDNGYSKDYTCGMFVANAISIAVEKYKDVPVIIINRGSSTLSKADKEIPSIFIGKQYSQRNEEYMSNIREGMIDTICEFSNNHPVYLVRPTPGYSQNVPVAMLRSTMLNNNVEKLKITREEHNASKFEYNQMQDAAAKRCGVRILDPTPYFCDKKYCYGDIDGVPLYYDDNHLSFFASERISPIYDEVFK